MSFYFYLCEARVPPRRRGPMGLREFFLWQLENEAAASRKLIDQVPEGRNTWKPNQESMELGDLAALVASIPGWVEVMLNQSELDLSEEAKERMRAKPVKSRAELSLMLAIGLARSRRALEDTTEEHLTKMWRFRSEGKVVHEGPRYAMISDAVMTHL